MRGTWIGTACLVACAAGVAAAQAGTVTVALQNASGADAGTVIFSRQGSDVQMQAQLKGLPPGQHAIHVHAVGTCTPPDFTSAGGHLNPASRHHGFNNPEGHHAGDFPMSVTVKADGTGNATLSSSDLSLDPTAGTSLFGKSVIVHELVDDQKTDPAGASGKRIACGVIPSAVLAK